jgi:trafficking protein particle complex subunit 11
MSHLWVRKHSELIPSVFISVYELATDSSDPKQYQTQDNQIIGSINHLKRFLSTGSSLIVSGGNEPTSRRTTLAVVLLSRQSFLECPSLDDRVSNIRKLTGLDMNKTFFFLPAHSSPVEMIAFVKATQLALLPACLEYYRELSKHTRRKKNRGSVPPPTVVPVGASHLLSNIGWNVRYEFKLGVFAEFRQEMDVASKCYETAYENLVNEIFMVTNHWNTRWNEARVLSDILAFRIVRCAIWIGSWALAVKRFDSHARRVKVLLDTKGNGSNT